VLSASELSTSDLDMAFAEAAFFAIVASFLSGSREMDAVVRR
jgi:hypothetical protein